jgi:heat shock protein HslJ
MTEPDLDPIVRDALRQRATRFEPTRGDLEPVVSRARRRERARRAGTAILALGIFAAAAVLVVPRLLPRSDEGRPAGQPGPLPGPTPTGSAEDLWGRTFISTSATRGGAHRPLVPETDIEVTFRRSTISFVAGCNGYGGELEITDDRLIVGEIMGTEVGCAPELHEQDEWLIEFFAGDPRWRLDEALLTLTSGETVLEFREVLASSDGLGETVLVPDVVGLPRREAVGMLENAGLAVEIRTVGETQGGVVLSQSPPAGAEVSVGGTIVLNIGPPPGESPSDLFFPTLAEPASGYPDALAVGTLVEQRGCVFLRGTDGSRTLLIWPFGWSIQATDDGSLRVLNESGTPVREVGKEVELGGGFVSENRNRTSFPEELIGEPIPDRCKAGGYFLTSG